LLPTNFLAFVLGGFTYFDGSACTYSPDGMVSETCERHLSTMDGGVFLAVIVVVGVLLSMWSMQRRDVP
jgi:ABC-2 type transport system permease protein